MLPLTAKAPPVSLLRTEFNEWCGAVSSDGKWIAYASDESGRSEVYVQAFSRTGVSGRKWQVSYKGGSWPKWRKDGRELFFISADKEIVSVDVESSGSFRSVAPRVLFAPGGYGPDARFDVTADGRRFIMPAPVTIAGSRPAEVILNWTRVISR
jgi:hypothetical protein